MSKPTTQQMLLARGNPGVEARYEAKDAERAKRFLLFAEQSVVDARAAMAVNPKSARLTAETAALSLGYAIDILKSMEA